MSNNKLTTLPYNIFKGLKNLKEIYLESNQITSINYDTFNMNCLRELDLSNNPIEINQMMLNGCVFVF